jgi:glycosyltransferase involved in cell wall biosynthesis
MNKPHLSIIIPVLNEIEQLEELITTLKDQSVFHNQVIIVDGGSTDGSYEWLEKKEGFIFFTCRHSTPERFRSNHSSGLYKKQQSRFLSITILR